MRFILYFLFNALALISLNLSAQSLLPPVDRSILLSGNFGELRATHFHSGIDIRTGGVEGWPVRCVQDGRIVRVSVSPTGYGNALYLEHDDGTTTVYGHLQRFDKRVTALVRTLQYARESFQIDEDLRADSLFVHRGDTIAYSGNTGSSGGPHLHFEIRNTLTEHTLNPLLFYRIRDTKAPVVKSLYLYRETEEGCVELIRSVALKNMAAGKYSAGLLSVPEGKVGVAVFALDYMEDSWNKLGIYDLKLVVRGDTVFEMKVDSCSFDQACLVNTLKDFDRYKKNETVYRCFGRYQDQLFGVKNRDGGWIVVKKDSILPVQLFLKDINGNQSSVSLKLKGKEAPSHRQREVLRYDRDYCLQFPGGTLELRAGCLPASVPKVLRVEKDTLLHTEVFVFAEKDTPLLKKARIFIAGQFEKNTLICELGPAGQKYPLATQWTKEGVTAEIGYLNRYALVQDSLAPEIRFLGKFQDGSLKFRVKDDLAGIATYRGEVNGKWCLFSYDPRKKLMSCRLSEPVFLSGQANEVRLEVIDQVGNRREIKIMHKK